MIRKYTIAATATNRIGNQLLNMVSPSRNLPVCTGPATAGRLSYDQLNGDRRDPEPQDEPPDLAPSLDPFVLNREIPSFPAVPPQAGQGVSPVLSEERTYASKTFEHSPHRYSYSGIDSSLIFPARRA